MSNILESYHIISKNTPLDDRSRCYELKEIKNPFEGLLTLQLKDGNTYQFKNGEFTLFSNNPFVNVLNYGAVGDGVTDCTESFNNACATGKTVYVPKGNWLISTPTASGCWLLDYGCRIEGLDYIDRGPFHMRDNSNLTGKVIDLSNITDHGFRVGSGNSWLERDIRRATECFAELSVLSGTGQIGILGATRTSMNDRNGMESIGLVGYGINDDPNNKKKTSWAGYLEIRRSDGCGNTHGLEIDNINYGTTTPLTPYSNLGVDSGINPNLWLSCGGGSDEFNSNPATCAIGILPNPTKFQRGIVFRNNSIDGSTNEAITLPKNYKISWYDETNQPIASQTSTLSTRISKQNVSTGCATDLSIRRKADTSTATAKNDMIYRHTFKGNTSDTNDIELGYLQCLQRSDFTDSKASSSIDISCTNTDGTISQVSLNGMGQKSFSPNPDNTISLGTPSARFTTIYSSTDTINTSDINCKDCIDIIDEKLIKAFLSIEPRVYKFKDSITKKGDEARIHMGFIAQELQNALITQGINPSKYAIWCEDEIYDIKIKDGVTYSIPTGEKRQALRYNHFIALIEASNRYRFNKVEKRLLDIEEKLLKLESIINK